VVGRPIAGHYPRVGEGVALDRDETSDRLVLEPGPNSQLRLGDGGGPVSKSALTFFAAFESSTRRDLRTAWPPRTPLVSVLQCEVVAKSSSTKRNRASRSASRG
jgi:hypothetical protein